MCGLALTDNPSFQTINILIIEEKHNFFIFSITHMDYTTD